MYDVRMCVEDSEVLVNCGAWYSHGVDVAVRGKDFGLALQEVCVADPYAIGVAIANDDGCCWFAVIKARVAPAVLIVLARMLVFAMGCLSSAVWFKSKIILLK